MLRAWHRAPDPYPASVAVDEQQIEPRLKVAGVSYAACHASVADAASL